MRRFVKNISKSRLSDKSLFEVRGAVKDTKGNLFTHTGRESAKSQSDAEALVIARLCQQMNRAIHQTDAITFGAWPC